MFHVDLELDRIIRESVNAKASDIHFDAVEEGVLIRLRIDGVLQDKETVKGQDGVALMNRIKVCSGLDISERRIPQDGRWQWSSDESISSLTAPMRVSTLPSMYGETIVCRILGNEGGTLTLRELGMSECMEKKVKTILERPYGLILVCGPTGSGKTATLYALLRQLNRDEENVISLENPIEVAIPKTVQVQINPRAGLTFETGLRAILRQDPDTIMVGEIRDKETAQLAIQAALTGHRVLSTIHTNTSIGVVERLVDMGVEKYLVEATLIGVLSQRLVRKKEGNSYKGRTALYELWAIPKEDVNWDNLEDYIAITMEDSARAALEKGITTLVECRRVGLLLESGL